METGVYSFEDTLASLGVQVKDLTLEDLYDIYTKYNLCVVIDILKKQVEVVSEE